MTAAPHAGSPEHRHRKNVALQPPRVRSNRSTESEKLSQAGYAGGLSPRGPTGAEAAAAPVRAFSSSLPARIVASMSFDSSR